MSNDLKRKADEASDEETPVLEIWWVWSTPSLSLLPSPL